MLHQSLLGDVESYMSQVQREQVLSCKLSKSSRATDALWCMQAAHNCGDSDPEGGPAGDSLCPR